MGIQVYKKFRLIEQKDGLFVKNDMRKLVRSAVKIDELDAETQNKAFKTSGIIYELDKKVTKERDEKLNPANKSANDDALKAQAEKEQAKKERDELKVKATELGIEYAKNASNDKLKELIDAANA